jgi:hypothetical protein
MGLLPVRPFPANQFHQQPMRRPLLRFRLGLQGKATAGVADQPRRVIPLFLVGSISAFQVFLLS